VLDVYASRRTSNCQVKIEILNNSFNPAKFMTRFIAGHYQLPTGARTQDIKDDAACSSRLYVDRGLGTQALPARIGAAPDIALLTLRCA
jgi:predicted MPP superfamily phosphohydrolase